MCISIHKKNPQQSVKKTKQNPREKGKSRCLWGQKVREDVTLNRGIQRNMLELVHRNTRAHSLGLNGPREKRDGLLDEGREGDQG